MKVTSSSAIRSKVEIYLRERREAGFKLKTNGLHIRSFARFAESRRHRGPITCPLVVAWAQASRRPGTYTAAHRLSELQPFLKFWNQRDSANQLVPRKLFGRGFRRVQPHIFTAKEIRELIDAARRWPGGGLRAATYATVFGLLAATGMRTAEALKLRREDVDLEQGVLTILETKFQKSRHVVLHPTTRRALKRYAKQRDRDPTNAHAENFFVVDGRRLEQDTLAYAFEKIRKCLGWRCRGDRRWPRIHDLRFTFICRRVERWYAEGRDVNHLMMSLSTYVGHVNPSATYWYLTATPSVSLPSSRQKTCSEPCFYGKSASPECMTYRRTFLADSRDKLGHTTY